MRKLAAAVVVLAMVSAPAYAAPCRDTHGKFIKCATATAKKPIRCKNAKGKFAKCGSAGAKPV